MAKLKQSQEIIKLGKKISLELMNNDSRDTTMKWMGNYIAELITNIENESDKTKKIEYEKECCDIILKIWDRRKQIPHGAKPLGNFENVLCALNSLRDKERSFDWNKMDPIEHIGVWGGFIKDIRKNYNDAINLALCSSVSLEILEKEKDWLTHENMLSEDEKKIIKHLDFLLTKNDSFFNFVVVEDGNEVKNKKQVDKKTQILNKLTAIIDKQNNTLEKLKKVVGNNI